MVNYGATVAATALIAASETSRRTSQISQRVKAKKNRDKIKAARKVKHRAKKP